MLKVAAAAVAGNAPEAAAENGTDADTNAFEFDATEAELEIDEDDAGKDEEGIDADTERLDDAEDAGNANCTATRDRMTEPGLSSSFSFSSCAAAAAAAAAEAFASLLPAPSLPPPSVIHSGA